MGDKDTVDSMRGRFKCYSFCKIDIRVDIMIFKLKLNYDEVGTN